MKRHHLFEFNESSWCPSFLREAIVEALGKSLRWGKIYDSAIPFFVHFVQRAGGGTILDLCSGSGESIAVFLDALKHQNLPATNFIVSDLYPRTFALKAVALRYPGKIKVIEEPIDASAVPQRYGHSARTIFAAFHHFRPDEATRILSDCVEKRRPIFIVEPFTRKIKGIIPLFFPFALASLALPFFAKRKRLLKLITSFPFPLMPLLGLWDGIVSICRVYEEEEIMEMVAPFRDVFHWEYHEIPIHGGGGVTVFWGVPKDDQPFPQ